MRHELRFALEQLRRLRHRIGVRAVDRDQIVLAEKEGDVDGIQVVWIIGGLAEGDRAHDEQQIGIELLQLYAGLGIDGLLDRERVEIEEVLEERYLLALRVSMSTQSVPSPEASGPAISSTGSLCLTPSRGPSSSSTGGVLGA